MPPENNENASATEHHHSKGGGGLTTKKATFHDENDAAKTPHRSKGRNDWQNLGEVYLRGYTQ